MCGSKEPLRSRTRPCRSSAIGGQRYPARARQTSRLFRESSLTPPWREPIWRSFTSHPGSYAGAVGDEPTTSIATLAACIRKASDAMGRVLRPRWPNASKSCILRKAPVRTTTSCASIRFASIHRRLSLRESSVHWQASVGCHGIRCGAVSIEPMHWANRRGGRRVESTRRADPHGVRRSEPRL